jgi:hypothetical protein
VCVQLDPSRSPPPSSERSTRLCHLFVLLLTFDAIACTRTERAASEPRETRCPSEVTSTPGDRRITLERTACLGSCPTYRVVIHHDGRVEWFGEQFVAVEGAARRCVRPDEVAALWRKIDDWQATHDAGVEHSPACIERETMADGHAVHFGATDQPTVRLILERDETMTTWEHDFGCPEPVDEGLLEMESAVRELVDVDAWVNGSSRPNPRFAGREI